MSFTCFTPSDFKVFDIPGFKPRMDAIKTRIPMPNQGDSHGGVFVSYSGNGNSMTAEVVSDQNGLQGSALDASLKGAPWVIAGVR